MLVAQNAHHGSRGNFLCIYWQPFKTILLPNRFDSAKPSHLQYMIILQYPFSTGKSQPSQVSALDTKNDAATLGFNVCRGTRITETKRTAITRRPHNPSIHIYVRVKTRQYIGSSLMTYTFDIAAKLHIQLYAYNSGIVGANRWQKCPLL